MTTLNSAATTFTLSTHEPQTLNPEARLELGRFRASCFSHDHPDDPPLVPDLEAEGMAQTWGDERWRRVLARTGDGTLAGEGQLFYDLTQNTDKAHLNVLVLPQLRRRGLGKQLAAQLAQEALSLGRSSYTAGSSSRVPAGEALAAQLGAKPALPMRISELLMAQLDQGLLAGWVERGEGEPYRLHRFTHIPDHELERVAKVYDVMNTAPRGELDFEDWVTTPEHVRSQQTAFEATGGQTLLYAVEHLPSAEFVAFSQVGWSARRASLVQQWGTGVRPDHRGQGLGKWVKAAILQDLPAHNPQAVRVRTGNADVNAAMLGINVALGFAPAFSLIEWQGQTQALLDRLHAGA